VSSCKSWKLFLFVPSVTLFGAFGCSDHAPPFAVDTVCVAVPVDSMTVDVLGVVAVLGVRVVDKSFWAGLVFVSVSVGALVIHVATGLVCVDAIFTSCFFGFDLSCFCVDTLTVTTAGTFGGCDHAPPLVSNTTGVAVPVGSATVNVVGVVTVLFIGVVHETFWALLVFVLVSVGALVEAVALGVMSVDAVFACAI